MFDWIRLVGPHQAVEICGVKLVGVNAENGGRLLISLIFICLLLVSNQLIRFVSRMILTGRENNRVRFWTRQGVHLVTALLLVIVLTSIWFDDPARLATVLGLMTAGLSFALQKVITALAGYVVILRGKTFNVGDRIRMGGVRGDVLDLGFIQTTIMEMGEPPEVQNNAPNMWVQSRQYTGRVVIVSNARIFDEPVYNYTRDFPYIWEEMHIPISYNADRSRAEQILLEAAKRHAVPARELNSEMLTELQRRYDMSSSVEPRVYYRLTDNWVELTVRFVVRDHGIRETKDAMSRQIIAGLEEAGIGIASSTYDIVGLPPIRIDGYTTNGLERAHATN